MSVPFFRAVCFAAVASLSTWLCACTDELTEIMVVVDSDMAVPGEIDRVVIEVEGLGDQRPVETMLGGFQSLPLSLGLVNEGDRLGPITVRVTARRGSSDVPVVVAERNGVHFKQGKTLMLRVDLLRECLTDASACVRSCADGACLTEWRGLPDKLDETDGGRGDAGDDAGGDDAGDDDAGVDDAGPIDAGNDASDAMIDAGPLDPCSVTGATCFDFTPSNFDPGALGAALEHNGAMIIDCLTAELDTTTLGFTGWCREIPEVVAITQDNAVDAIVIPVTSLTVTGGGLLRLVGNRPVIFAVFGDASITGVIDARAIGGAPGAGGDAWCSVGRGAAGATYMNAMDGYGGGGGGGASFGGLGAAGGRGDRNMGSLAVAGMLEGEPTLVPLRGGCPGGRGGIGTVTDGANLGGGGGGAIQISVASTLTIGGVLAVGGGGGSGGKLDEDGGGGGGSGGAILCEAQSIDLSPNARLNANGGGGGGASDYDSAMTQPGLDAPRDADVGGNGGAGDNRGGNGGRGAGLGMAAVVGENGETGAVIPFPAPFGAGGGGGGGGQGRIRLRDFTMASGACTFSAHISPLPSVECGG